MRPGSDGMRVERRNFLKVATFAGVWPIMRAAWSATAAAQQLTWESIVDNPEAPTAGNPKGDVTIVAFLDYNCQYCKKSTPDLDRVVKTDGNIRLVYKDCPVLTEASVYGARMFLAAKYQGAYDQVHAALMRVPGKRNPQSNMEEAVQASGVDLARLKMDLAKHGQEIEALIRRNIAQARALGFEGVPNFLIGPLKASGYLDFETLQSAIQQARGLAKGN
jgi:protein-disulfide isomerase